MKSTPRRTRFASHPCIFRGEYIRDVDRHVQHHWAARFIRGAPFSRLRLSWREQHCAVLNPYRSIDCPYSERDCSLAFWKCVEETIHDATSEAHAIGYFRTHAKRMALDRVENKPLARERSGDTGTPTVGSGAGPDLPRTDSRPERLADILSRALDSGPRPGPVRKDGETCPE